MGCSASTPEDGKAVKLCRDRRSFIRQAMEQRTRFAAGHLAYIRSLKRVSDALRHYVDGDEHRGWFFSDPCSTPPFTPVKRLIGSEIVGISLKPFPPPSNLPRKSSRMVLYLRSGGNNPEVSAEERPRPPEPVRIISYFPWDPLGPDGFFTVRSSPMIQSFFSSSPPSPQNSPWDFFWNPFSQPAGYATDDETETAGLRQIREEEGIPDPGEEEEVGKPEDLDRPDEHSCNSDATHDAKEFRTRGADSEEVSETQIAADRLVSNGQELAGNRETVEEEAPGFTARMNRPPTSMAEVMRDIDRQFSGICDVAGDLSVMLETGRARHSSALNELTDQDGGDETAGDLSEELGAMSGSHQSTLERLYAWEKKLYEEVRSGDRIRTAYEKKRMQLRIQDVNGEDPSVVDKTRVAERDLRTRIKVSIHAVEAISKRIERLRDEELHPQLVELIRRLGEMWRSMAERHYIQKRTIDEAKRLLSTTAPPGGAPPRASLSRPAARLEAELRRWRCCLRSWVTAQRSYAGALAGWLLLCAHISEVVDDAPTLAQSPLSPPRSSGAPPIFGVCVRWSRLLDAVAEQRALEGLDLFAAGVFTVAGQQREAEDAAARRGARATVVVLEGEEEGGGIITPEKAAELAVRVLCAGMSVAVTALAEFAAELRDGYEELQRRCCLPGGDENGKVTRTEA